MPPVSLDYTPLGYFKQGVRSIATVGDMDVTVVVASRNRRFELLASRRIRTHHRSDGGHDWLRCVRR